MKRERFLENKSEINLDSTRENIENSEENLQKDLLNSSTEETEVKKSNKSQVEVN